MRLTHFGGTALPTASEEIDLGFDGRNALIGLRDGSYDQDGAALPGSLAPISRSFKIVDSIDATLNGLKQVARQGRKILKGLWRDGTTYVQTFAKVTSFRQPRAPGDVNYQQVDMTFTPDYPYWLATADEPLYLDNGLVLDGTPTLYMDGNYTPGTITTTSWAGTITNNGGCAIPRGKVLFIPATGGTIVNPKISNAANRQWIQYGGTVAAPHRLEIDFLTRSVKLDGINAYNVTTVEQGQMDWMTLELGANPITIASDSVAGTVAFEWHFSRHYT